MIPHCYGACLLLKHVHFWWFANKNLFDCWISRHVARLRPMLLLLFSFPYLRWNYSLMINFRYLMCGRHHPLCLEITFHDSAHIIVTFSVTFCNKCWQCCVTKRETKISIQLLVAFSVSGLNLDFIGSKTVVNESAAHLLLLDNKSSQVR